VNLNRLFVFGAIAVVIAGLALAFGFLGTPAHQRQVSMDKRRINDLIDITNSLHNRYQDGALPRYLPESITARDPASRQTYEYRRVDATHYVLCAAFDTNDHFESGDESTGPAVAWPRYAWQHGRGRTCYQFDVTETPSVPRRV